MFEGLKCQDVVSRLTHTVGWCEEGKIWGDFLVSGLDSTVVPVPPSRNERSLGRGGLEVLVGHLSPWQWSLTTCLKLRAATGLVFWTCGGKTTSVVS